MNSVLDYYNRKEIPTLILATPAQTPITTLGQAYNVKSTLRFIEQNELTFDFPKSINNGKTELEVYSKIQTKMTVILEGVGIYVISECPEDSTGNVPIKHVVAKSLEYEMLFKRVNAFSYTSIKFYDYVTPADTVMGKIMKLIPGWSIDYLDPDLVDLYRTFDVGTNTVYNLLTSDVAKAFGCIFRFDSLRKTISAYLIGNLEDNVGVYISQDNIADSITVTQYSDEIATALHCYGGTNLDIRRVNPLGGNIIYNFDYFINDTSNQWMSDNLKFALTQWNDKAESQKEQYAQYSLISDSLLKQKVEVGQSIADTKSALSANITKLEGLNAAPTDGLSPEALAELEASIAQTTSDIANLKLSIRVLRREKAEIQESIDENLSLLRAIIHSLKFTGEESWRMFADETLLMLKDVQYYSENWGTIYFETADEEEMDVYQLNEEAPEINQLFSELVETINYLTMEVAGKELQYWSMSTYATDAVLNRIAMTIIAIDSLVAKLHNLISNTDIVIDLKSIKEMLLSYAEIAGFDTNLTKAEYGELQSFIFYNTYTNENIIITDTMTDEDVQYWSQELYNQSVEVIKRVSNPRYEFSGNFLNILDNKKFSEFAEKIDLGKQVTIELPGGNILDDATLIEIAYEYENPASFSMVFSNKVKLNTSNFVFADMFIEGVQGSSGVSGITAGQGGQGGAITTSDSVAGNNLLSVTNALISKLGYISFGPNPPLEYGNYVGSWLGYDRGAKFSLYSSANDYLQWDGQKLLIKARNFTLDSMGNITANNADLSGKITALSGDIGGWVIGEDTLSSDGNKIVLDSSSPKITMNGVTEPADGTPGVYMGQYAEGDYAFRMGDLAGDYFMWDKDGIHTGGDWLAGWEIGETFLTSGTGSLTVRIDSSDGSTPAFSAGSAVVGVAPFRVYHDGSLYATKATVSGSIYAEAGEIGGWNVTSTCIIDTSGSVGLSSASASGSAIRFWAGDTNPGDAQFRVYDNGVLYATNAYINGSVVANEVNAISGSIGGWIVADNNLHSGTGASYVEINSGSTIDYTIIAGNNDSGLAPFVLYKDGSIFASSASITGNITAESGEIGGWTIMDTSLVAPSGTAGITSGDYAFYAGDTDPSVADFSVTYDGEIKATSGEIAGWSITSSSFVSPSGSAGIISASGVSDSDFVFFSGGATPEESTFYVTNGGKLVAKNISAIGNIDATSGNIGEWAIEEGALYSIDKAIYLNAEYSKITVGDPGNSSGSIIIDGADSSIRSDNYTPSAAGFAIRGNGDAEFNNVKVRGEIQSAIFKYNEISATAGTLGVYKSADVLSEDLTTTSGSFALYTSNITSNLFSINDILRIKNGTIADNWIKVLQTPITGSISYYECELLDGSESTFEKGTTVIDYGQYENGDGFLYMSSDETYAPYYSVKTITSASPWNDTSEKVRIGNIASFNGITGSPTRYGIAVGEEDNYLYYSTEDGLVIKGNVTITSGNVDRNALPSDVPKITYGDEPTNNQTGDYWAGTNFLRRYDSSIPGWVEVIGGYATASQIEAITNGYSSDNVLSIEEKYGIKPTYESIISSTSGSQYIIDNYTNIFNNYSGSQISASPIYETAALALINYMETQGFLNDMTISSGVVRTEWDSTWGEYFSASGSLTQSLNLIVSEMSNWGNLQDIPAEIAGDVPNEDGLYINADYIGYYSSTANAFKSYIDKNGNMRLGDIGGAYFNWDSSSSLLNIKDAEFSLYSDGNKVIDINPSSGSPYIAVAKANFGDSTNGIWMGKSDGEYKLDIGAPNKFIRWDGDSLNIVGGDIIMGNQDSPLIRISQGSGAGTAATAFPYFSLGDPSPLSYDDPNKGVWIGRREGVDYTAFKTFDGSGSTILIAEDGKIITTMAPQYTFRVGDVGGAYFGWDGDSLVINGAELYGTTTVGGNIISSCAITSTSTITTSSLVVTGTADIKDLIISSAITTSSLVVSGSSSITNLTVSSAISASSITATGLISANGGLTIPSGKTLSVTGATISGTNYSVSSSGSTTTSALSVSGTSALGVVNSGALTSSGQIKGTSGSFTGVLSAGGLITANGGVTIPSGDTLTINSGGSIVVNGISTLGVVNASGLITADGGLTIPSGDTLTISSGGSLVVSGTIKDGSGVEYSKTTHDHNTSYIGVDGWVGVSGTWSYASATTITVPSGATSIYSIGDKIKLTQTTVKYFYIVGVADTLLTITGGSSYTLTSATITSPYYSKSVSPLGFPQWLAYTPTGIANSNVTKSGRFMVAGRLVTVMIQATFAGGITFTTMPSLPITASSNILSGQVNYTATGYAAYVDSGTAYVPNSLHPAVLAGATTVSINGNDSAGSNISATYPITWANGDILYAYFVYEI